MMTSRKTRRPGESPAYVFARNRFSKLGKFQFDGFSLAKDRRFDLVVRTSKTLPSDFCSHIVNLFKTSLHDVDYVGNISINVKENFIKIGEDEITQSQIRDGVYI